jgi:hypothetical protein
VNPEKAEDWRKRNPEKLADYAKKAQRKKRVAGMQTIEGVKKELNRLRWVKEWDRFGDGPMFERGIANWAGHAIERVNCEEVVECLKSTGKVMKARRDTLEFYNEETYCRGDKPTGVLLVGWKGWVTTPKALDKLMDYLGLDRLDYAGLDWSRPDYFSLNPLRNCWGVDLTKIRVGDRWKGWKLDQQLADHWLRSIPATIRGALNYESETWGYEIVSVATGEVLHCWYVDIEDGLRVTENAHIGILIWLRGLYDPEPVESIESSDDFSNEKAISSLVE